LYRFRIKLSVNKYVSLLKYRDICFIILSICLSRFILPAWVQVVTLTYMKTVVFWDMSPCRLAYSCWLFGDVCCYFLRTLLGLPLRMEGRKLIRNVGECVQIFVGPYLWRHNVHIFTVVLESGVLYFDFVTYVLGVSNELWYGLLLLLLLLLLLFRHLSPWTQMQVYSID
jgi:hypothetical protein